MAIYQIELTCAPKVFHKILDTFIKYYLYCEVNSYPDEDEYLIRGAMLDYDPVHDDVSLNYFLDEISNLKGTTGSVITVIRIDNLNEVVYKVELGCE